MSSALPEIIWYPTTVRGWRNCRVKSAIESFDAGVWGDDPYDNNSATPVIRSNEIDESGEWRVTTPALRLLSPQEQKRARLLQGDLLIVKSSGSRTHIGKTAVVTSEIEYLGSCFSNFTGRLRVNYLKTCSRFLWYFLNNSPGRDQLFYQGTTTTGLINLSATSVGCARFCSPPLAEQQRIATYLDASCAAIDAAVAAKRRQIETLDGVRRDIVQKAVTRGLEEHPTLKQTGNVWLKEIPCTWELVSLKRMSEIQTGLTLGKIYEGPLIERPYLRVANVQDGHLTLEDVTTIEVPVEVARRVELRPGDVLMTEGGDLDKLGRGTIWSGEIPDCLHQNHIFAIRCFKHKLVPAFLAYLTASRYGRDYFEATGKRTTNLASTNSTKVGLFPIPRPSIAEQRAICQFLDVKLNQITQIVNGIESQIATLTSYRKSLIYECVTGQRRITESDVQRAAAQRKFDNLALTG